MPTKARKAKESAEKNAQAEFEKALAGCIKQTGDNLLGDLCKLSNLSKGGLVKISDDGPDYHPNIRKGFKASNDKKHEAKTSNIKQLQSKYASIWHKRGSAKIIAISETDVGNKIGARTIQKYIKANPIN